MLIRAKNGQFLRFRPFPDKEVVKGQKKRLTFWEVSLFKINYLQIINKLCFVDPN